MLPTGIGKNARYAYTLLIGPIPEGLQICHLCRVSHCVNPAHLGHLTSAENTHRNTKTHCLQGHPYDEANTYINPSTRRRRCRACLREAARHRRA